MWIILRKIRARQVNRPFFFPSPFFEGNLDLPECVATSTTGMGGQLQREWRLAGRNSITLEKQADPAVTNEMAADDRAVLCAGTNTTGIFLFFPFFFFLFLYLLSRCYLDLRLN